MYKDRHPFLPGMGTCPWIALKRELAVHQALPSQEWVRPSPAYFHVDHSPVQQPPAESNWAGKRLQGLAWQTLKMLTWAWGANAAGEIEAHPFLRIQIPFKDTSHLSQLYKGSFGIIASAKQAPPRAKLALTLAWASCQGRAPARLA